MIDIGFLFGLIIIITLVWYLTVLEITGTKKTICYTDTEKDTEKDTDTSKIDPIYVYFRSIPEKLDYSFKHEKLTQRKKPEHKDYSYSKKQMYFSLNKLLRHFYITDDFNKKEILQLNYIPDNFDFTDYISNRKKILGDTIELNDFLPNHMAKAIMEIDDNIQEINENEEINENYKRTKISYRKNKITLKTHDNFFLNIKYSRYPKEEYDISAVNKNITQSVIKLRKSLIKSSSKKKKYKYYLKFPNDHYLCINKDDLLFSSKDRNKIFYFEMVKVKPKN
jgi:hypothetical protein